MVFLLYFDNHPNQMIYMVMDDEICLIIILLLMIELFWKVSCYGHGLLMFNSIARQVGSFLLYLKQEDFRW